MENNFSEAVWTFRVQGDAIRSYQRSDSLRAHDERYFSRVSRSLRGHPPSRHPGFFFQLGAHTHHIRLVLTKLWDYGLFAKSEKCEFNQTSIEFLAYMISPTGITMDEPRQWKSLIVLSQLG